MLVQDLFENRMHDAYSVFQQLAGAVHNSEDIDLRVGHELMPLQSWQARHLLGQYKSIAKRQGPDAAMRFLADYNAITAALDAMDTRLGQMKNMRGSLPGQRAVDETHNHDEPEECYTCRGTGEGQFDGTSCSACGGSGIVRPTRDDDDFDIPDDYDMREAAPDPKHLQRYGHELDQRFPDISNSVADRGVTVPNSKEVAGQTAHPNKHFQSTPFHTNGAKLATVVRPGTTPPRVKRLDTPTTVPNFLKKSVAQEDARPGPLERSAPHTQKKTVDQLTHLQALNGLEETVSLMRAANRRISENLSLMEFDPTGFGHGGRGQGPNYERLRRLASRWWSANTEERRLRAEGELEALGYEIHELETGQQGVQLTPYGNYHIDDVVEFLVQDLYEAWSQKYKKSINCSHPKGFSQKAHCAGKKKHNESVEMEMVCEDCGMCQTHGNLNEIKKGQKDSNGFTRCWPGKHAVGTKKGKNGGQVRNCKPNESQGVAEGWKDVIAGGAMALGALGAGHAQAADLSNYNTQYLQQVVSGEHPRPMVSIDDAKAELQARANGKQQSVPTPAKSEKPKGFSKEYLQSVIDGTHPRPLISKERAQELLQQQTTNEQGVAEDSGAWPFQEINELSNDKLAQYKSAAGRAATAADRAGNYELGNKRFRGITQATKKQFANDVKKHKPQ